ncbi:hypothetical protein QBC37DRAFT_486306 [Rhypophila decipiens]|uniref:Uncharacterized protein n=1 Tax=Rhypophila decipiens TaxID=261697 RepID=A0AAN6XYA7_9PEZI|nr:hypothetical protein QBC37DRAFT_486306 [Rhypophila decipiens]
MANPQLTPVLTIETSVPAPVSRLQDDGTFKVEPSPDAKIGLKQLYCVRHIEGGAEVWQSSMISPVSSAGNSVLVYDVTQSITATTNTVVLAAVSTDANQSQTLYTAVQSNGCGGFKPDGQSLIALGTKAIGGLLSDNYTIPAQDDSNADPVPVPPPQVYQSILQVLPGNLPGFFAGTSTLFKMANETQVVASQKGTTLVVLAVSASNDLYYIRGTRTKSGSTTIVWEASGLPIRSDVLEISTQYNLSSASIELIYVTNTNATVGHLYLTPESAIWQESIIPVRPASKQPQTLTYPAHTLSCDWAYATVNNGTYTLSNTTPTKITTDSAGSINIVQRISDSIAAPSYEVGLTQFGSTSISVDPAQRILTQLPKYTTAGSLKAAKTTDGRPVQFPNTDNFDAAAGLLGRFQAVHDNVSKSSTNTSTEACSLNLAVSRVKSTPAAIESFTQLESGEYVKDDGSWISDAATDVANFFGDAWECIKSGLRTGIKFALQVLDQGISIFLSIAGKIFRFVLRTAASVLRTFAGFLKSALGIDINGFLDWLGFVFDIGKVLETQKSVNKTIKAGFDFVSYSVTAFQPIIAQLFDTIKDQLSQWIPDARPAPPDAGHSNLFTKLLGFIFDNPIMKFLGKFNPMNWLMTQASNILGDVIQLPDLSGLIGVIMNAIGNTLDEEGNNITRLLTDVLNKFTAVFDGKANVFEAIAQLLGDTFWTLFDAIKIVLANALKAIPDIMTELWKVITSPIKLPIISPIWNAFMGPDTPLTILNAMTVIPSWALNMYAGTVYGKMPFDAEGFGDPAKVIPSEGTGRRSKAGQEASKPTFTANTASIVNLQMSTAGPPNNSSPNPTTPPQPPNKPSPDPTNPPPQPTSKPLSNLQIFDLILSMLSPTAGAISGLVDVYCIFSDAIAADNVQTTPGQGARRIITDNNELDVFLRGEGRFEKAPAAAPPSSDILLRIFRGVVAVFVLFCCLYNFIIGIKYQDGDWKDVWQYGVGGYIPSGSTSTDVRTLASTIFTSFSALFTCLGRALGEDPQAAAIIFIALGFDAANAVVCGIIYGVSTENTLPSAAQQPSIAAVADVVVRSSSTAGVPDKNDNSGSAQYKLPKHLDSMFLKAAMF